MSVEKIIFQIIAAIFTTFGFGLMFNIKHKNLFHTSIAGGLSWAVYLLGQHLNYSEGLTFFIATFALALYSEAVSRIIYTPVTTILIAALIPLAPGGGIYYTMYNLIDKNYPMAVQKGIQTFIIAGAMAVGIFSASTVFRLYDEIKSRINKKI